MRFAEAVARRDADALIEARFALSEKVGSEGLVDAAGVAANFQRMVRIADSIGIPVDNMDSEVGRGVRHALGLERFPSAVNSANKQG